jgi:signal transduction histidine kinase/ActR/RegA family two-component response regulator
MSAEARVGAPAGVRTDPIGPVAASDEAQQAALERLARQARADAWPVAFAVLALLGVTFVHLPVGVLAGSVGVAALVVLARGRALDRLAADTARPAPARLRRAGAVGIASAAAFAAVAVAAPWLPDAERALLTLVVLALAALTSIGAAGGRSATASALLLGASALGWLLVPADTLSVGVRAGIAALLLGVVLMLRRRAGELEALAAEAHGLRAAQAALGARHDAALARLRVAEGATVRSIAAIGHRLRQPVYALRLFAASLGEQPLEPRAAELARRVDGSGQDLAHDLETLLDLSQLEAGTLHLEREPVEAEHVVRRVIASLEPLAVLRGLSFGHEFEPGLRADTDRRLLERVLRTLAVGAIARTASGGVTIEARREAGWCVIEVIDSGRALEPEELARLTDMRVPPDPSGDLAPAVAARLVQRLDASLRAHTEPDAGTTLRLELPLAPDASPGEASAAPAEGASAGMLAGLHVLVVDDEPAVRAGTRFVLEDRGARVSVAADPAEAMASALVDRPDATLVDLRLGRGDSGLRLALRLRERWPGLVLVLISGDRSPEALRAADAAGLPVLGKPIDAERLVRALRQAGGPTAAPSVR